MKNKVSKFCDNVQEKLSTLEGRMESLKLNVGSTSHHFQEKLDKVRLEDESTKQGVSEARTALKQWDDEKQAETKEMIDQWIENRETQKLTARAQKVEDCAGIAIKIAQASIDDVERMVLEAIAARRDAEAVIVA